MVDGKSLQFMKDRLHKLKAEIPHMQVVLGSGFGEALDSVDAKTWKNVGEIPFGDVPGLTPSSVMDHPGKYRLYQHLPSKKFVLFQMGRLHGYEGHSPQATVAPLMIPRLCGVQNFLLTNASGGLDKKIKPGEVVLISDHINMTGTNPLLGPNPKDPSGKEIGPRFPDMGNAFSAEWRKKLKPILKKHKLNVHDGVYLGLLGPTYETHAEVRLFASWKAKAVGMSTVWEAIALKHSGARIAGISMVSNAAAGLVKNQSLDHKDILKTCRASAAKVIGAILDFTAAEVFE